MKFETYLPIFPGFYYTIFDEADSFVSCELDTEECFREHYPELAAVPWEKIENGFFDCVDYTAGNLAVAVACVGALPCLLPDFVKSATIQEMRSPREYNFANDAINCELEIDVDCVIKYLTENMAAFEAWLKKRYTSCDGFMSHHSTDSEDWINPEEWDGHQAGAILDFIASEEIDDPQMGLYYAADCSEAFCSGVEIDTSRLLN